MRFGFIKFRRRAGKAGERSGSGLRVAGRRLIYWLLMRLARVDPNSHKPADPLTYAGARHLYTLIELFYLLESLVSNHVGATPPAVRVLSACPAVFSCCQTNLTPCLICQS